MTYKFQVGKTYLTQRGEAVRVVIRHAELRGYETVVGDDGAHRYDRSTNDSDAGRCTGTAHDYSDPDNFVRPPQEVEWVPVGVSGMPRRLRRDEVIALISPLSNNSADHDIEFAQRVMDACGVGGNDGR